MTKAEKTLIYNKLDKIADEFANGNGLITGDDLHIALCFILENWEALTGGEE